MSVSPRQLLKGLIDVGLLKVDEARELSTTLKSNDDSGTQVLVERLVAKGKLTRYQASAAAGGKTAGLVFGDYLLLDKIGAGGMGQVYRAEHRRMKRVVALKVLPPSMTKDKSAVKRFLREVEAAARLSHPNIVTALDAREERGMHYLVMEYVPGTDLSQQVKAAGALPVEQAMRYVLQAARGLAYAHSQGVIHRDMKPGNLLAGPDGSVKVLDMGLARFEDGSDGLTGTEQIMGTVDYMSPEQAADTKSADARSDIYSLGCTLWHLLTARRMFDGDTLIARMMQHREAPAPSLCQAREGVPLGLDDLFQRMVAKRPAERPQSMNEVVAALETLLSGNAGDDSASVLDDFRELSDHSRESTIGRRSRIGHGSKPSLAAPARQVETTLDARRSDSGTDPDGQRVGSSREPGSSTSVSALRRRKTEAPNTRRNVLLIGGGAGVLVIGAIVAFFLSSRGSDPPPVAKNPPPSPPVSKQPQAAVAIRKPALPDPDEPLPLPLLDVTAKAGQSIDLWKLIDFGRDVRAGRWKRMGNAYVNDGEATGIIDLPCSVPAEYRVSLGVRRSGGNGWLSVGLPVGGQRVNFVVDGYGGSASGLEDVDGMDINDTRNPTRQVKKLLTNDKPQVLDLTVSPTNLTVAIDGQQVYSTSLVRRLTVDDAACDQTHPSIQLASVWRISKIELTPLGEAAKHEFSSRRERMRFRLRGLVGNPKPIDGLGRWQLFTSVPSLGVTAVTMSPDGRQFAIADEGGFVRLYDVDPWKPTAIVDTGYGVVNCMAWHPAGNRIAVGHDLTGTCILDRRGNVLRNLPSYHPRSIAWSPDQRMLAAGGTDNVITVWDEKYDRVGAFKPSGGGTGTVLSIAFGPDSQTLVAGYNNGRARIWSVRGAAGPELVVGGSDVNGVVWGPQGQIVCGGTEGILRSFKPDGSPGTIAERSPSPGTIKSLTWSPATERLALGRSDTIELRTFDGTLFSMFPARGSSSVSSLAYSADGKHLAWTNLGLFGVWHADKPGDEWITPRCQISAVAWMPDGSMAAVGANTGVRFVSPDGRQTHAFSAGDVRAIAWSPDGKMLATGDTMNVRLFDAAGKAGPVLIGHTKMLRGVAFSPDGKQLASVSEDETVRLWTVEGQAGPVLRGHVGAVQGVSWSKTGLATCGADKTVRFWKPDGTAGPVVEATKEALTSVAWSHDGTRLLAATSNVTGGAVLLDATGKVLATLSGGRYAWSPDDSRLASLDPNPPSALRIRQSASSKQESVWPAHEWHSFAVAWSSRNNLISVGDDATVRGWDATGQPLWTMLALRDQTNLTLSADGQIANSTSLIENTLVYLVEHPDGSRELLTPSQFSQRKTSLAAK